MACFTVENPKHSDFNKLRNMLITTHMQDLKDVTEDVYYENFRVQCISQISQQAIRERGYVIILYFYLWFRLLTARQPGSHFSPLTIYDSPGLS